MLGKKIKWGIRKGEGKKERRWKNDRIRNGEGGEAKLERGKTYFFSNIYIPIRLFFIW